MHGTGTPSIFERTTSLSGGRMPAAYSLYTYSHCAALVINCAVITIVGSRVCSSMWAIKHCLCHDGRWKSHSQGRGFAITRSRSRILSGQNGLGSAAWKAQHFRHFVESSAVSTVCGKLSRLDSSWKAQPLRQSVVRC